jgi:hypothetical protein
LLYTLGRSDWELALITREGIEMRIILVGFLLTGLVVIGLSTYDRELATGGPVPAMVTNEDGTPIPQPSPKPKAPVIR